MALGWLRGVKEIQGVPVQRVGEPVNPQAHIFIEDEINIIAFQMQNGMDNDVSVQGCHLVALLEVVRIILEARLDRLPCTLQEQALGYLELAIKKMEHQTKHRNENGVAGCIRHREDGEQRCDRE